MKKLLSIIVLLGIGLAADAGVRLSPIFSSHMVLQQKSVTGIWGCADPGKTVTVVTSWDSASYNAKAGEDGAWRVDVTTPSYGGPYSISISTDKKDRIILEDVLIGDVWLCGGQSNMEMKMLDNVVGGEQDMMDITDNTELRFLHIDRAISASGEPEPVIFGDGWCSCGYGKVFDFSAAAFYFGRAINRELGIPVGLIESCWGGSRIEPWISPETVKLMPEVSAKAITEEEKQQFRKDDFENWLAKWDAEVKAICSFPKDKADWKDYTVPGTLEEALGCPDFNGLFWMRKNVDLPAHWAGKDIVLRLESVDDYDFLYFNGKYIAHGEGYTTVRRYTIPGKFVKAGRNVITLRVLDGEGDAGIYTGADGDNYLSLYGKEKISMNGPWKALLDAPLDKVPQFPEHAYSFLDRPSTMFNGMIAPLVGYDIRGVIWYQGCSNTPEPEAYSILQPMLIHDWRSLWGHDFPFYITQLANFMDVQTGAEESNWAFLREAQSMSAKNVEGAGMACIIDLGEAGDIHPKDKVDVGERLALQALAKTYGKDVVSSGPQYSGYSIEGSSIRIRFNTYGTGLRTGHRDIRKIVTNFTDEPVEGFYIAGPDKVFHKASASIDGDSVIVSSKEVTCPVAVRYAWANNPVCNLVGGTGLPAEPFRTDNWTRKH